MNDIKRVLNIYGELRQELTATLEALEIEILTEDDGGEFQMLFIGEYELYEGLVSSFDVINRNIPVFSLVPVKKNKEAFFLNNGKGWFSHDDMDDSIGLVIIKKILGAAVGIRLEESYGAQLNHFNTLTISSPTSMGYFIDVIISDVMERNFSFHEIRLVLTDLLSLLMFYKKSEIARMPFEVGFGDSNTGYVAQVAISVENFFTDYIIDSFRQDSKKLAYSLLLERCTQFTHMMEIDFIKTAGKLVFTCYWKNQQKINGSNTFLLNEIERIEMYERRWRSFRNEPELRLAANSESIEGEYADLGPKRLTPNRQSGSLPGGFKRIMRFVEMEVDVSQDRWSSVKDVTREDLDEILSRYPNATAIEALTETNRKTIHSILQHDEMQESVRDSNHELLQENFDRVKGTGDIFKQILHKVKGMSLEQLSEYIKVSGKFDINQDIIRIKGDENSDFTGGNLMVKGTGEGNIHDDKIVVPGFSITAGQTSFSVSDRKNWEAVKSNIIDQLEQNQDSLGATEDVSDLSNMLSEIIEGQIGAGIDLSATVASELLDDTFPLALNEDDLVIFNDAFNDEEIAPIENEVNLPPKGFALKQSKNLAEDGSDDVLPISGASKEVSQDVLIHKDKQIEKMRQIITSMKGQLVKLAEKANQSEFRQNDKLSQEASPTGEEAPDLFPDFPMVDEPQLFNDSFDDVTDVDKLKNIIEAKNVEITKLRTGQLNRESMREDYVKALIKENEKLKAQAIVGRSDTMEKKLLESYKEKQLLMQNEIEDYKKRLFREQQETIQVKQKLKQLENMESQMSYMANQLKVATAKQNQLQTSLKAQENLVTKLQDSNNDQIVTEQISQENATAGDDIENMENAFKQSAMEKDMTITKLNIELKEALDKTQKAEQIVKVMEQKMKMFQSAKSTAASESLNQAKTVNNQSAKLNQFQHKVKQLEKLNEKLGESSKRMQEDLAGRKKEVHQFKQENATLKNKIAELERKVGAKKAS